MNVFNSKSIAVKLSVFIIVIVLLQSTFLFGAVAVSGVISSIRGSAYSAFSEKVYNRKNYLQNEMNTRFSNITANLTNVKNIYDGLLGDKTELDTEQIEMFLGVIAPEVVRMLRSTMTTGGFVILDDNKTDSSAHSVVYFKDYDPAFNDVFNKDLYMIKGPTEVSTLMQIPLEKTWSYGITFDEGSRDLFYKPYDAAVETQDIKFLGYWGVSPSTGGNGENMLTYTLPLIDKNGKAFGVIGIEVVGDQLYKILPNNELSKNTALGYVLARENSETGELLPVLTQGTIQDEIVTAGVPLQLNVKADYSDVCEIVNSKAGFTVFCHEEPLKLYNSNTPFEKEQLVLVGLVDKASILGFSEEVIRLLLLAFLVSTVAGIALTVIVSRHFTMPIKKLSEKVRINDPEKVVSLGRTGLSEIDDLSVAIEMLNQNVIEELLKTDKIIDMVGLPVGTFEYVADRDYVLTSKYIMDILGFAGERAAINRVDKKAFFDKINRIKNNIEDELEKIYLLEQNGSCWVKIVSIEKEHGILGVVMDVSKDILEKHSMLFERDYDSLTGIYNRFAFKKEAQKVLEEGIIGKAAFVMFDLDNLKYINDTYGHDYGDSYIKSAAQVLLASFTDNALVGRMSGDEFYVFLFNEKSEDIIRQKLKAMYDRLEVNRIILPSGSDFKIRMSGGIAWYGKDSNFFDELVHLADFAMYQSKHTVKGEIREFDRKIYDAESFMLSGREELNKVLDNQLIEFAFQPIISAITGDIYGFESLMRPQSEVLNSPTKLIQVATSQSRLWQIEKIVFFKTLSSYLKHQDLFKQTKIFINSVPNEMLKPTEYAEIERLYSSVLKNVVIEIIENEKLDTETLKAKREIAARWGAMVALDDYGTGYNGDVSLLSISPHIVKIDRMMTLGIEKDKSRQSIVKKLIIYAKEQGILVLAEGVERKEQLEYLVNAGVDLLQGFYIGRPEFIPDFSSKIIKKEIEDIRIAGEL